MDSTTTATTCPICGNLVFEGQGHTCPGQKSYIPKFLFVLDEKSQASLDRIAAALESIDKAIRYLAKIK
jgi:hypothetical protein